MIEEFHNGVSNEHERLLRKAHSAAVKSVKEKLLLQVLRLAPDAFEKLVVRLLLRLRYGCRGEVCGRSGDGGIDGIIYEDLLGFSKIYIQAKLWTGPVGREDVQKFFGALNGRAATKGVFITTSRFTAGARSFITSLNPKVVLIDGSQLVELMYDCNLGVAPSAQFELKQLTGDVLPSPTSA